MKYKHVDVFHDLFEVLYKLRLMSRKSAEKFLHKWAVMKRPK